MRRSIKREACQVYGDCDVLELHYGQCQSDERAYDLSVQFFTNFLTVGSSGMSSSPMSSLTSLAILVISD